MAATQAPRAPYSLARHLQQAATERPHAIALLSAGSSRTFAGLLDDSERLAQAMARRPGPVIQSGDSLLLASHAYACSLENRPFWPVDRAPKESTATSQLCWPSCCAGASSVPLGCSSKPPAEAGQPLSEAALIISTSGSEGRPRAVVLGDAQLDAAAAAANGSLPLHPGDLWLDCLPLYHIGGLSILWRCARAGATVLLHDGFAAAQVAGDLAIRPVTHISLVPAMLARLLDLGVRPPPSLRVALIGGAALPRALYDQAVAAGWPLYVSYGMSETAALIAVHAPADGPWQEGLVGRPMAGHEIRIADDGRLRIRGPQVMAGYADGGGVDGEGWLTTGDLGAIDGAGRLSIRGRADDLLISGGRNVHPQEVEACLAACPGVDDIAVTGLPDPVWGDLVVALVVGAVEPAALLAHARRHLPSAALPRKFRFIDRLPRNAAGKLERATLRRLAAEAGQ